MRGEVRRGILDTVGKGSSADDSDGPTPSKRAKSTKKVVKRSSKTVTKHHRGERYDRPSTPVPDRKWFAAYAASESDDSFSNSSSESEESEEEVSGLDNINWFTRKTTHSRKKSSHGGKRKRKRVTLTDIVPRLAEGEECSRSQNLSSSSPGLVCEFTFMHLWQRCCK